MDNSAVECLPYTEKVAGSSPAPSTNYSYDLGVIEAFKKIGMYKSAVSPAWIRKGVQGGVAHRQAVSGAGGSSAKEISGALNPALSKATNTKEQIAAVQSAKQQLNVGNRSVPVQGSKADLNPLARRPADYKPPVAAEAKGGWKTPTMLIGGGVGLGTMLSSPGQSNY